MRRSLCAPDPLAVVLDRFLLQHLQSQGAGESVLAQVRGVLSIGQQRPGSETRLAQLLQVAETGDFTVVVGGLVHPVCPVKVTHALTVAELMLRIEAVSGIPSCEQQLFHTGALLAWTSGTLAACGVTPLRNSIKVRRRRHPTPQDSLAQLQAVGWHPTSAAEWAAVQHTVWLGAPALRFGWIRVWSRSREKEYYMRLPDGLATFNYDIARL